MEFSYKKHDNRKLFTSLVENNILQVSQCQNYIPLYEKFFTINETNYNSIHLNNKYSLHSIKSKETDNIFNGVVLNQTNSNKEKKDIFRHESLRKKRGNEGDRDKADRKKREN